MRFTKEDNLASRGLVEEAISIDPEFGVAYSFLAMTHFLDVVLQATKSPGQSITKAIELARKGVAYGVASVSGTVLIDQRHGGESVPAGKKPTIDLPRRRTWKEGQELKYLPARIEELETRQAELHELMADPAFYQETGDRVAAAKTELEAIAAELSRSYDRWEELEGLEA